MCKLGIVWKLPLNLHTDLYTFWRWTFYIFQDINSLPKQGFKIVYGAFLWKFFQHNTESAVLFCSHARGIATPHFDTEGYKISDSYSTRPEFLFIALH